MQVKSSERDKIEQKEDVPIIIDKEERAQVSHKYIREQIK